MAHHSSHKIEKQNPATTAMTGFIATATKKTPDSKVGLGFASEEGRIILIRIAETSLFSESLRPGLEIITINETAVRGMTANEVKALLNSIQGEVAIQARPIRQSFILASPYKNASSTPFKIPELPTLFKSKQVPENDWRDFVYQYQTDMLPHLDNTVNLERIFNKLMDGFVGQQMVRGYVGFGSESMQEKKAFTLTHHAAIEHSNLSMVANNLIMEANAMFNPYNIWATLIFEEKSVPKIPGVDGIPLSTLVPTGIKFVAPASA